MQYIVGTKITNKSEVDVYMQTTYKVGDKVRIISTDAALCGFSIGDEVKITKSKHDGSKTSGRHTFEVEGFGFCNAEHIELIEAKPTKNQRISTLEQKVEAMQAEIDALKATQKAMVSAPNFTVKSDADISKVASELAKVFAKEKKKLSPNEQRKAIIGEAKAFVAENTVFEEFKGTMHHGVVLKSGAYVKPVYWVLPEKRIVEVNMVGVISDKSHAKGIAKCSHGDVFNADIGKAIALGRALGLDVSKFEKAVQPTEAKAGSVAELRGQFFNETVTMKSGDSDYFDSEVCLKRNPDRLIAILNDSEAQY